MIIYKVTNLVNGKIYIGSSSLTLHKRQYYHFYEAFKKDSKKYFHKALRKYGKENFTWEVIKYNADTIEDLLKLEHDYIEKFKSFGEGYNLTEGFDNTTLGYKFTKEQKEYLVEIRKNKPNPNLGNKWSDEQKKEASIRQKENHKHLIGKNNLSKEARDKIRQSKLGKNNPQAKRWDITFPDGKQIFLFGGLKRFLKENGLTYMMIIPMLKGKVTQYKGWRISYV